MANEVDVEEVEVCFNLMVLLSDDKFATGESANDEPQALEYDAVFSRKEVRRSRHGWRRGSGVLGRGHENKDASLSGEAEAKTVGSVVRAFSYA
jgi:hypothetical protein